MSGAVQDIAWGPVRRILADMEALFSETSGLLGDEVPQPAVTLDLPATDPEPQHAFVLSNAHDFEVVGFLSNATVRVSFDVDVVCVATADTADAAARTANAYQALLFQIPLVDNDLGGTVEEVGAPQVADYRTWADGDGRRHAGYRLSFNMTKGVQASDAARQVIYERNG